MILWKLQGPERLSIWYSHGCNCLMTQRWAMKILSQLVTACMCYLYISQAYGLRWQNSLLQSCDSCVILCVPLQCLGRRAYVIFIVGYFCRLMVADMSRVKQIRNSIYCWDTWVNQHKKRWRTQKTRAHISLTVTHAQKHTQDKQTRGLVWC